MRKDDWQVTISSVRCQPPKNIKNIIILEVFFLNLQRHDRLATHMSIMRRVPLRVDVRVGVQREGREGREGGRCPTPAALRQGTIVN